MKRVSDPRWIVLLFGALLVTEPVLSSVQDHYDEWADCPNLWQNQGGSISNHREAPFETKISNESLASLSLKWTALAGQDVAAGPAIDGCGRGVLYFPSWDGFTYAVTKDTGELIWKVNLTEIAPEVPGLLEGANVIAYYKILTPPFANFSNLVSRVTPTIAGPLLLFGVYNPCYVLALNRTTGALVWWSKVDSHPHCIFSQSGTYYQGGFYLGTSSAEVSYPPANCCTCQGAMFKLDAKTGRKLWRVPMLPDNHNKTGLYSGASIWGSSPSIDTSRGLVYIASGNLYSSPPDITACELAQVNMTNRTFPDPCLRQDNHEESFVAINIDTGKVAWATHLGGYDTWLQDCQLNRSTPGCPPILGPDADFGEAPFLLTIKEPHNSSWRSRDIVVAGEKSGRVYALDRGTGDILWKTDAGPGSTAGGASWGMTTDGERVYTNIINGYHLNFTLVPTTKVITWGGWVAMNASTGAVVWSTASPDPFGTQSPLSYANGVVFGASEGNFSSVEPRGKIVALDSRTGALLWNYTTLGGLGGGASIMDGCLFQPVGGLPTQVSNSPANVVHGRSTIALCVP